jgi:hypothetical protein
MSLPASVLLGQIAQIIDAEGVTQSAAEKINQFVQSKKRLLDLKRAPDELGVSSRTMFRWIKNGKLRVETIAGMKFVDVSKLSVGGNGVCES